MSVAWEIEVETFRPVRPALFVLPDQPAPRHLRRRRRLAAAAVAVAVLALLVLLALPLRPLGGSTLAQAAPAHGQEYVVKAGDTLASIAHRADPGHAAALAGRLAQETGSSVLVPGEHVFIP